MDGIGGKKLFDLLLTQLLQLPIIFLGSYTSLIPNREEVTYIQMLKIC